MDYFSLDNASATLFPPDYFDDFVPEIQPIQIVILVFYGLVALLGIPGNALVVWVTGFHMQRSVTSIWFLNLALADLLCCLSLPLLMVPLALDDHWPFGSLACTLVKSMFYLVMYCSILQLVLISLDRWILVSRPVWCQNHRRPKKAICGCIAVWCLALISSIPDFVYTKQIKFGDDKRHCQNVFPSKGSALRITSVRFLMGFVLPFLVIVVCHCMVYRRAESGMSRSRTRSKRTLRIILAVVLSFFLCWLPLHILDFIYLNTLQSSLNGPTIYNLQSLAVCLAYFNSCINPFLYVCMGRGFKDSMTRSLRNMFNFISEDPTSRMSIATSETKSTSNGREMTKI